LVGDQGPACVQITPGEGKTRSACLQIAMAEGEKRCAGVQGHKR
jgi:hypothetical protein